MPYDKHGTWQDSDNDSDHVTPEHLPGEWITTKGEVGLMGWWAANEAGDSFQDGGLVWGDVPADIMGNALEEIDKAFQESWGRKPTLTELIAGLKFTARISHD